MAAPPGDGVERRVSERGRPDPRIGPSLFVAVPLPAAAREAVEALVRSVRRDPDRPAGGPRDPRDVRWVRLSGLHLTLRFLGPTPGARVPDLSAIVDAVAAQATAFPVRLAGTGAFPSPHSPRTLWIGVADGVAQLEALAAALDERLAAAGWPSDGRPFRAHLTLARSDGVRSGPGVARALAEAATERGFAASFDADRIVLFESRTGDGPAHYEPLHEARLAG